MKVNWDKRFLELSEHIATWSKDRSRGVAAIIVDNQNRILSIGYNGFPAGLNDNIDSRHERPIKYMYTEHAERNSIYNAAKNGISIDGAKIYVKWFPCADCARAIIQSGISTLICLAPDFNDKIWGESFRVAYEMLNECKINIVYEE